MADSDVTNPRKHPMEKFPVFRLVQQLRIYEGAHYSQQYESVRKKRKTLKIKTLLIYKDGKYKYPRCGFRLSNCKSSHVQHSLPWKRYDNVKRCYGRWQQRSKLRWSNRRLARNVTPYWRGGRACYDSKINYRSLYFSETTG